MRLSCSVNMRSRITNASTASTITIVLDFPPALLNASIFAIVATGKRNDFIFESAPRMYGAFVFVLSVMSIRWDKFSIYAIQIYNTKKEAQPIPFLVPTAPQTIWLMKLSQMPPFKKLQHISIAPMLSIRDFLRLRRNLHKCANASCLTWFSSSVYPF